MNKPSILIAEDDLNLAQLIQTFLERNELRVTLVHDGKEVIKTVEREQPGPVHRQEARQHRGDRLHARQCGIGFGRGDAQRPHAGREHLGFHDARDRRVEADDAQRRQLIGAAGLIAGRKFAILQQAAAIIKQRVEPFAVIDTADELLS